MASPDDKLAEIASPEPNYASPANNNSNNNNNRNNSIIIIIIIITFILIQEKRFTDSLLNWNFCATTFFICHYTDFGNGECCRRRIGLFTPFKNKFQ